MGSGCTQSYTELPTTSEVVAGTQVPEWMSAAGRGLFEEAVNAASNPYPTNGPPRTMTYTDGSKLTDDELAGMSILREGAESYLPFMNRASDIANTLGEGYETMSQEELLGDPFQGASREDLLGDYQGATREELLGDPFSLETAQPYMDLYQSAMDPAVREIEEQTIRAQNEARARASTGGGGFGSRLGIMEATTAGEGAQAAGDLRAGAAREGLDFAVGRYDTDRASRAATEDRLRGQFDADRSARGATEDRLRGQYDTDRSARFSAEDSARTAYETNEAARIQQMDAYQGMGVLAQELQTQAAAGLIGAGEVQRQLDQSALEVAYADFLDQQNYDQEQINFALGALSGVPYNTINRSYSTGTTMSANPSIFGQTLAGAGGLYSAYKMANG